MGKETSRATPINRSVDIWAVQCDKCWKWRKIPTQEAFEEIRSKFKEDPFCCSKKDGVSCDDPGDIEFDSTRTWVADKPNLPKTPPGFKRRLVMRRDLSKMDVYYDHAKARSLRSTAQVASFLENNKSEFKDISVSDFSFNTPRIMEATVPEGLKRKTSLASVTLADDSLEQNNKTDKKDEVLKVDC